MSDSRKAWTFKGCSIQPESVGSADPKPTCCGPIYFGVNHRQPYQRRWWKVTFPDGTWIRCANKARCVGYIERNLADHQA